MLHEILMSLWGCSTNALQILESDVIIIFIDIVIHFELYL